MKHRFDEALRRQGRGKAAAADPEKWRAPPQKRDWIEYACIGLALVLAGYFFG